VRICIVGASGKLGACMVDHALDQGHEVVAVCRPHSVAKLAAFTGRITVEPGATDDRDVIRRAVAGCGAVLVVLVPRGVHQYATGTAQAVLDAADPGARLVFSCGWHITLDGQDVCTWKLKAQVAVGGRLARLARFADLDDQVEATRRVLASDRRWDRRPRQSPRRGRQPGDCRSGVATSATPSSRATSPAASTSRCSWSRRSTTTTSSMRRRRSSAVKARRHSRTLTPRAATPPDHPPRGRRTKSTPEPKGTEWTCRPRIRCASKAISRLG
jgi:NAD(P)H-binding